MDDETVKKINVIIKSDVLGSAEAIEESLIKLNTDEVKVKVLKKGLGAVTESDVDRAFSSNAVILGFNANAPHALQLLAREKNVEIKTYKIIYELVDYIRQKMESVLGDKITRKDLGELKVLAIFKKTEAGQVIGGKIDKGIIESKSKADVVRGEQIIGQGEIINVQSGKEDVKRAETGQECGVNVKSDVDIQAGDVLRVYKEEINAKKL